MTTKERRLRRWFQSGNIDPDLADEVEWALDEIDRLRAENLELQKAILRESTRRVWEK